jgi:small subunit ribosomal protein S21
MKYAGVIVGENESLDKALKRFRRECIMSGILVEMKRKAYYEKPSERRRKEMIERRRMPKMRKYRSL